MAVTSRHNKYTSIPDWFSGQSTETATTSSSVSQTVYISGSSGSTTTDSTVDFKDIPIDASTIVWQNELLTVPIDNDKIIIVDGKLTTSLNSDGVWELRLLADGTNYIYTTYPVVTQLGITMYSGTEGLDIEGIYDGLPIDNNTIYWDIDSDGNRVLKAIGSSGGGVADSVAWSNIEDKPSWLLDNKISYSEIEGTPDLSKYALVSQIPSLEGYALSSDLAKYIPISGYTDITGEKNFTGGLKVNGSPIYYDTEKKYWKLEGDLLVTGGVTMYGNDSDFVASTIMDAILYDDTTLGINSQGKLYVKDSVGGATTLGSLTNVGSWADSVASQDRIMYQAANSSQWVAKNLSDLAVGGVTGDYLPLSGGTINGSGDYLYVPLYINALNNQISGITFKTNGAGRGHVGYNSGLGIRLHSSTAAGIAVSDSGEPIFYTADGSIKNTIWHAGNDGSGSGLDADLLDGYHVSDVSKPFGGIPTIGSTGYMDIGSNLDFHYDNTTGSDYSVRLKCTGNHTVTVSLPSSGGTLALTTDNVASATKLQTARTIWGQSFDGTGDIGNKSGSDASSIHIVDNRNDGVGGYQAIRFYYNTENQATIHYFHNNYNGFAWTSKNINIDTDHITFGDWSSPTMIVNRNTGNVGIGTPNPIAKLQVEGLVKITAPLYGVGLEIVKDANDISSINLASTSTDFWQISARYTSSENGNLKIYYYDGSTWANPLSINKSGNILVSGGITMYSARKLKTIQDEIGLSLEELSVIKPTRFTWKDGRDNKVHIGGIADDVMKVLPEVIYKTGEDDTLTMDYGNAAFAIAASLIKPVVNHEERIKMLEEENKKLKEEVEQLKWNIA